MNFSLKNFSKLGLVFVYVYLILTAYLVWYSYTCKYAFCGAAIITAYLPWINIPGVDSGLTIIGKFLIKYFPPIYVSLLFSAFVAYLWYAVGLLLQKFLRKIKFMQSLRKLKDNSPVIFWFLMLYVLLILLFYVLGKYPYSETGRTESVIASVLMMPTLLIFHYVDKFKPNTGSYFSDETFGLTYFISGFVNFFVYYLTLSALTGFLRRKFS